MDSKGTIKLPICHLHLQLRLRRLLSLRLRQQRQCLFARCSKITEIDLQPIGRHEWRRNFEIEARRDQARKRDVRGNQLIGEDFAEILSHVNRADEIHLSRVMSTK